jgi:hypothetical protein
MLYSRTRAIVFPDYPGTPMDPATACGVNDKVDWRGTLTKVSVRVDQSRKCDGFEQDHLVVRCNEASLTIMWRTLRINLDSENTIAETPLESLTR